MLSATQRPHRSIRTRALAVVAAMVAVALVSQLATRLVAAPTSQLAVLDPAGPSIVDLEPVSNDPGSGTDLAGSAGAVVDPASRRVDDLARIRADLAFWSARVGANPDDFISSNRLGVTQIEFARATGDLGAYLAADAAFDLTLQRDPTNAAALGYKGSVLVSLHRFSEAAAGARAVLDRRPNDPVALATLGDAELELGNIDDARGAYARAAAIAPSAATTGRIAHLAFIAGDAAAAVRAATDAATSSVAEGAEGERAAFYQYQLADVLISTGDRGGAARAYAAALDMDPNSFLALSGLARVAVADGDLDEAIRRLGAAIAIVPQPEFLARRADLYTLRGRPGDDGLAAADAATVGAIAQLAGEAASVYDRTLALYLANHALEPDRAVSLARAELAVRKDVYGYDTLAWTLLQAGRASDADEPMRAALAFGTVDAKLLYHAGMIDAALGRTGEARTHLEAAVALDPSFDPLQVQRAREVLTTLP